MADWKRASDVGARLRELRKKLGWTQARFADVVGVTTQSTSDWENEVSAPPKSRLRSIANRFRLPIEAFGEGGPRPADVVVLDTNVLREEVVIPGYLPERGDNTRAAAADDAQKVAGQIIVRRMAGRKFMPVSEAIEYMAAVTEAAAGRPIKLPPLPETSEEDLPPGQTGT